MLGSGNYLNTNTCQVGPQSAGQRWTGKILRIPVPDGNAFRHCEENRALRQCATDVEKRFGLIERAEDSDVLCAPIVMTAEYFVKTTQPEGKLGRRDYGESRCLRPGSCPPTRRSLRPRAATTPPFGIRRHPGPSGCRVLWPRRAAVGAESGIQWARCAFHQNRCTALFRDGVSPH